MRSLKILVAEDHHPNRYLLVNQLLSLGHIVDEAASGSEALALFVSGRYDVVFTDCNMPGMDGYALVIELRKVERLRTNKNACMIGYTACSLDIAHLRCRLSGMDACLVKPVSLKALKKCLEELLDPVSAVSNFEEIARGSQSEQGIILEVFSKLHEENKKNLDLVKSLLASEAWSEINSLVHKVLGGARLAKADDLVEAALYFQEVSQLGIRDVRFHRSLRSVMYELVELQANLRNYLMANNIQIK